MAYLRWGIEMPQVWRRSFAHLNMKKKCQVTTTMRVVGRTKYRGGLEYMEPETADVSQPDFLVGATNFSNCVHPKLDNTAEKCSVNGPFLPFTIHHKYMFFKPGPSFFGGEVGLGLSQVPTPRRSGNRVPPIGFI